jgi:hypothetical protein
MSSADSRARAAATGGSISLAVPYLPSPMPTVSIAICAQ